MYSMYMYKYDGLYVCMYLYFDNNYKRKVVFWVPTHFLTRRYIKCKSRYVLAIALTQLFKLNKMFHKE